MVSRGVEKHLSIRMSLLKRQQLSLRGDREGQRGRGRSRRNMKMDRVRETEKRYMMVRITEKRGRE